MITFTANITGPIFTGGLASTVDRDVIAMLADVGAYAQRLAVDKAPTGVTFNLRGSIVSELHGSPAARSQEVSSSVFYAPIQEEGRKPGRPPPAGALLLWVTRKLGAGNNAQSVAFLVARQIGRSGTKGHHMFQQAFDKAVPYFERQAEALGAQITHEANG
jgi:hypothetical protein